MRRNVGALALVVLVLSTTALVVLTSASAQTAAPTRALALVRQTPFVGPTGTFRIEVRTDDLPADTSLTMTVHQQVPSRARLDRTITGEQLGTTVTSTTPVTITGATTTMTLPITAVWPAPAGGAVLSLAGVYPVTVDATARDGRRLGRLVTHLIRLPDADSPTDPLEVGAIVSIDAVPTIDRDGAATLSEDDATRTRAQLRALDATAVPPLSAAISPFVAESLRAEGSTLTPPPATRQLLATPWVSIDAVSLDAGGLTSTIVDEYAAGAETLARLFDREPDRRVRVIDGTTSPRVLDLAPAQGVRAVVLDATQLRSALETGGSDVLTRQFVIESADGNRFAAMASDGAAAARFAFVDDPELAANQALAELAMLHFEQPAAGRGVAVVLPAMTSPAALTTFLSALTQRTGETSGSTGAAVIEPVTLDGLLSSTAVASDRGQPLVRRWTSDAPVGLGSWTEVYGEVRWDLLGLASLVPDAPELTGPVERSALTAAARSLSDEQRRSILEATRRTITDLAGGVSMPATQTVTLSSRTGDIPITIDNALPAEAAVRVTISSPKVDFPDGSSIDLVLPPGPTRTAIAVTTRASGAFPLQVSVASIDGVLPVTTSRIDVRSTAISGWGLVLSIGAGAFLLVWWIRHFRHTRRARSLLDPTEMETLSSRPH